MYPWIEPNLYIDIQARVREASCSRCGGVCYSPGYHCLRCERRAP